MPSPKKKSAAPLPDAPRPHEPWLSNLQSLARSGDTAEILITGNTQDLFINPEAGQADPHGRVRNETSLDELVEGVLNHFDVIFELSGIAELRILKGEEEAEKYWQDKHWLNRTGRLPTFEDSLSRFGLLREQALKKGGNPTFALVVQLPGSLSNFKNLSGISSLENAYQSASILSSWARSAPSQTGGPLVVLIANSPMTLHPVLAENRECARISIPYPSEPEFKALAGNPPRLAKTLPGHWGEQFALGTTVYQALSALRAASPLTAPRSDPPPPAESSLVGHEEVRTHLRQDFQLWQSGDKKANASYYLLCGPRGTGKSTLIESLAFAARFPVFIPDGLFHLPVQLRPFDISDWLAQVAAQPRGVLLFPDCERLPGFGLAPTDAQPGLAAEIQHYLREFVKKDRERRFLMFATSARPDLLVPFTLLTEGEDYRLPLFPTSHTHEGFRLVQAILKHRFELELAETDYYSVEENIPWLLTAAEALILATKTYRLVKLKDAPVAKAFNRAAKEHHSPLENKVLEHHIRVAIDESSEPGFVPDLIRNHFVAQ